MNENEGKRSLLEKILLAGFLHVHTLRMVFFSSLHTKL